MSGSARGCEWCRSVHFHITWGHLGFAPSPRAFFGLLRGLVGFKKKKNERKKSRFESGLEGSDGWMGGGGREEVGSCVRAPCSALKNSLKMGSRAKCGPSSRLSHYNWACNCHSSPLPPPLSSFTVVTHYACKTQRRSLQDRHLGIHAMLMALSFTSCQCLLMKPYINIQVCAVCLQAGR